MILIISSMKGGVGKTETALNLAIAAKKTGRSVILLDLDIPYGGVAQALGQTKEISVTDWIKTNRSISPKALKSLVAVNEENGLHYIPAIASTSDLDRLDGQVVQRIINSLNSLYDIIIIDSGVDLSEPTKAALQISDKIIIVTTANHVSAQNNYRYKEDLVSLGIDRDKLLLFINMIPEQKAAGQIVKNIVTTFGETGSSTQTVAEVHYDEKVAQIREAHGFAYNNCPSFRSGIDQVLQKLGLANPIFSQEAKPNKTNAASPGVVGWLKGLIPWSR